MTSRKGERKRNSFSLKHQKKDANLQMRTYAKTNALKVSW